MTPLTRLPRGARARVTQLPQPHGLAKRLCAMGLTPGAEVYVLQNRGRGPLIVEVHGARLALGRGQADRVAVEPMELSGSAREGEAEAACGVEAAADGKPASDAEAAAAGAGAHTDPPAGQ